MVYPLEHVLIRFNGHFGTSTTVADRWSTGLRIGHPTQAPAYDVGKLQTLVNACQAAAITWHGLAAALAGTNCFLDYVSGAQIGVSGKYTPQGQLTVVSPTTPTAGSGVGIQPWNSAGVISLRTTLPRGRASNGRMYWPMLAVTPLAATGRVTAGQVSSRVAAFKTFLDAVNSAANSYSAGERVIVASNVGGGLIATVTAIRSDDRIDSIERRENDQPSVWSTVNLA